MSDDEADGPGLSRIPESDIDILGDEGITISEQAMISPKLSYPRHRATVKGLNCRGYCLLINERRFENRFGLNERFGTDIDANRLEKLFRCLGFYVRRFNDISRDDLRGLLKDTAENYPPDAECFVCIILTHGACEGSPRSRRSVLFMKDGNIPLTDVINCFRCGQCRSLLGKPKIFFVQACDGDVQKSSSGKDAAFRTANVLKLPIESDILLVYSSVPGCLSWGGRLPVSRTTNNGSWFVQELCNVLQADADAEIHHDIVTLLLSVVRQVRDKCPPNSRTISFASTLTRLMYLTRN
ncbi:unnamed protein product [Calicophoron daubneyi]|uniref:Caspase-8 n=1 Tax=Calicophoron daubneyi TaxID=300641 RepID=A0AAV2TIW5_CALDB